MKVAITGASGLIGRALARSLRADGHETVALVRRQPNPGEVAWDPQRGTVDTAGLRDVDAVVHLAGEPIEAKPLTGAKRRRLRDSRVDGTRTVAEALASMDGGPRVLLAASGSNYYGDRGDEVLTEASGPGTSGLLTEISREWERAADPARAAGVRVVAMRTGIVLDRRATILKVMGTLARLGAAAPVGSGTQYWPWVSLADTVGLYRHALDTGEVTGALNLAGPAPVTNAEFTRTLAKVLHRPAFPVPVPRALPRLLLGRDLADTLLFTSTRLLPERALATGYRFTHPTLEAALRAVYGR
ncbi:MAG: TIGR01777 family protein [Euzebyales bacterium]|nr:TIGR01777 family protein [Euzebyales bacterium]